MPVLPGSGFTSSHSSGASLSAKLWRSSADERGLCVTAERDKRRLNALRRAAARMIETQTDALLDSQRRVAEKAGELERDADKHFDDIRTGGRSFKRPFRP